MFVPALLPGQAGGCEGGDGVVDGPGYDHVVVERHHGGGEEVGEAEPGKERGQVGVERGRAQTGVLAQGDLQEEAGDADEEEHDGVGDEEGAAAVLVAQVRESPDVSQA